MNYMKTLEYDREFNKKKKGEDDRKSNFFKNVFCAFKIK
jgi:hypothetical protein